MTSQPYVRFEYDPVAKTIAISQDTSGGGCCGENRRCWQPVATLDAMTFVTELQDSVGKGQRMVFTM